MPIDKKELTKEMLEKAMRCKSADELIALAKTGGFEMTKEEAESYMEELSDFELDGFCGCFVIMMAVIQIVIYINKCCLLFVFYL